MTAYFDRIWFSATSGGTGSFVVSAAVTGFRTPASASVPNGSVVTYVAESADKTQWEIGIGTYTSGTTTLSRDTVRSSSTGSLINFSAAPSVFIDLTAGEVFPALNLDAATNTVTNFQISHETTGTPAVGIGTGLAFATETAAGNVEVGASIQAVTTDVGAATEDFDLLFKTMAAGAAAAERMRIGSGGYTSIGYAGVSQLHDGTPVVLNVAGNGNNDWLAEIRGYGDHATGTEWIISKTRGAAPATHAAVQTNNQIGALVFRASDGDQFVNAAEIRAAVDGTPGNNDMPGVLQFSTTADGSNTLTERMRIDSAGRMILGGSANIDDDRLQVAGLDASGSSVSGMRFSDTATGPFFQLNKSRATTIGTHTIVQNGDQLGLFSFNGSNGSLWVQAATIHAAVDGTPGAGSDMPGRLVFSTTADAAASATERMRINSTGDVAIGMDGGSTSFNGFPVRTTIASTFASHWGTRFHAYGNNSSGAFNLFTKSRNTSPASHTTVSAGDLIANLGFFGSDGTNYLEAARISTHVDTPGSNDMPGHIRFSTTPVGFGGSDPVERLRIPSAGGLMMPEITAPAAPAANNLHIYVVDVAGVTKLAVKDSAGTETVLGAGGGGGISNVVEDTTPQLGGALDINGQFLEVLSANTSTAANIKMRHTTSGTPAAGIGLDLQFEVETASTPNYEIGASIGAVTTDVTGASEDFDLSLKLMAAGAAVAERFRFTSVGGLFISDPGVSISGNYTVARDVSRTYLNDAGNSEIQLRIGGTMRGFIKTGSSGFQSPISIGTNEDTYLGRNAAGVVEINNGTAGTYRDLTCRSIERNGRVIDTVQTLTDGATPALDASLGNVFKLLAAGNRTIAVPTNKPAAGKFQKIIIMHEASGADRTLALTTGSAGAFRFGTDITGLTATTSGLVDYIGCVYNAGDDRWDVVSYVKGF